MRKLLIIILIMVTTCILFSCRKKEAAHHEYSYPEMTPPCDNDTIAIDTTTQPKKSISTERYTPDKSRHSSTQSHKNSYGSEEIVGFDDDVDDDDDMELYMTDYH